MYLLYLHNVALMSFVSVCVCVDVCHYMCKFRHRFHEVMAQRALMRAVPSLHVVTICVFIAYQI